MSARSITTGTCCRSGPSGFGRSSWPGNRSAGNAQSRGYAPTPRWWTTSNRSGETGNCLSIRPTTRACASIITIRRRPMNRLKNDEKRGVFECPIWTQAAERLGAWAPAWITHPSPHPGKFCEAVKIPRFHLGAKNFPHRRTGRAGEFVWRCLDARTEAAN